MARRLTGLNPLSYLGVDPVNPTQAVIYNRNPTVNDYDNFTLQCQWLNSSTQQVWVLVSKTDFIAVWKELTGGGGSGGIQTITGDVGGAVGPDPSNNIDLQGGAHYVFTGNPGSNLLTLTDNGTIAYTYTGDSGVATPSANNLNIVGSGIISTTGSGDTLTITAAGSVPVSIDVDSGGPVTPSAGVLNVLGGNNITTTGAGNTITVDVTGTTNHAVQIGNATGSLTSLAVGTNGQVLIGATGANPAFATLTSTGGTIAFTPGANTLNLEAVITPGALTIDANTGTAAPSAGILNVLGSSGITTTGSGNTVTITPSGSIATTYDGNTGSATPSSNIINIVGDGTTATTVASGNTVTITAIGGGVGTAPSQIVGSRIVHTTSATTYTSLFSDAGVSTLASAEYTMPVSGTFSLMYATVGVNGSGNTNTVTFFKNGSATPLTISYGAGATGVFSDLVHSVSVNVGDTVNFENSQATVAQFLPEISLTFTPSSGGGSGGATPQFFGANTAANSTLGIRWASPFSGVSSSPSGDSQYIMPIAGTIRNLYASVSSNGSTTDCTITLDVNGSNTPLVATIPALTTGAFTDLTHSVSVNVGDIIQWELSQPTTSNTAVCISAEFIASSGGGGSGDLVLLETQTVSGVSAVNFTSGITNTYRNFVLMFDSVPLYYSGLGTAFLTIQLSTDSGSTYINTGYIDATASNMIGLDITSSFLTSSDSLGSGQYNIYNLTSGTGYVTAGAASTIRFSPTTISIAPGPTVSGGYTVAATTVNAIRIIWDSSSPDTISGTFSLYGYVK